MAIVACSTSMRPAMGDFCSGFIEPHQTDIEVGVTYLAWTDSALPLQACCWAAEPLVFDC